MDKDLAEMLSKLLKIDLDSDVELHIHKVEVDSDGNVVESEHVDVSGGDAPHAPVKDEHPRCAAYGPDATICTFLYGHEGKHGDRATTELGLTVYPRWTDAENMSDDDAFRTTRDRGPAGAFLAMELHKIVLAHRARQMVMDAESWSQGSTDQG